MPQLAPELMPELASELMPELPPDELPLPELPLDDPPPPDDEPLPLELMLESDMLLDAELLTMLLLLDGMESDEPPLEDDGAEAPDDREYRESSVVTHVSVGVPLAPVV